MTAKRLTTTVLFSLLVLPLAAPAQTPEECTQFDDVAILVTESALIEKDSVINGDVVVNDAGAALELDTRTTVFGDVRADTVQIEADVTVTGEIECNTGDSACTGLSLPVFDELPPFQLATVRDEAEDVVVGNNQFLTLAAGEYGDVSVGKNATLALAGGGYEFRSWVGGSDGSLLFDAPSDVRILGRLKAGVRSIIGPSSGSGLAARDIVIYVAGADGQQAAADIDRSSDVDANFYVAQGTFDLDRQSEMAGSVIARRAIMKRETNFDVDTYFRNASPTADDQGVDTQGASSIEITLTGNDPDGSDLTFSVPSFGEEGYPAAGDLSGLAPVVPPAVSRCSVSGGSCSVDTDCPLYPNESCDTAQLPVTSATVTYTPDAPSANAFDQFAFTVTDECGLSDDGTVTLNSDETGTEDPEPFAANDVTTSTTPQTQVGVVLTAGPSSDPITYTIESLPSGGALADSGGMTIEDTPYELPDNLVFYTPAAGTASDSFGYSATAGSASDTATVTIGVAEPFELAPDQQLVTAVDSPIQFTLLAQPGGSGSGGGQAPVSQASQEPTTQGIAGAPAPTPGSGNGARDARSGAILFDASGQPSGPHNLVFGAGWSSTSTVPPAFFWGSGEPVFAQDGPFTFTGPGCVSVTDDFRAGDEFRIYDNGQSIGTTSSVDEGAADVDNGPDVAFADPAYSSGSFVVGAGSHSITVEVIANPVGGGRAYIRVDTDCIQPNLEVTSFSAPSSAILDEPIGDQIFTTVQNTGTANIAPGTLSSIGFYVSADATITTADELLVGGRENLSQQAPNGLAIGESVAIDLFDGATVSGTLLGDVYIGVLVDEFDAITESDEGDNTASQSIAVSADQQPQLTWEITSVPLSSAGIVTTLQGVTVTVGQTFTSTPTLVYQPASGFSGSTSLSYEVTQGTVLDTATVDFAVTALGNCLENEDFCDDGRFGGGGGGFTQAVLPAGSPGVIFEVEGPGTVAASPLGVGHGRTPVTCGGECSGRFLQGETVIVAARPTEAKAEFVGWRGDCSGDGVLALMTAREDARCVAVFRVLRGWDR